MLPQVVYEYRIAAVHAQCKLSFRNIRLAKPVSPEQAFLDVNWALGKCVINESHDIMSVPWQYNIYPLHDTV